MTDAKKATIVPMANLVSGQVFDKRSIQVPFDRVVNAVNEIDTDFGALLHEGKGYTLLLNPVSLSMLRDQQEHNQQQYHSQHHMPRQFGVPYGQLHGMPAAYFGIIPNGHDRVLVLEGRVATAEMHMGMVGHLNPIQLVATQFAAVIDNILGTSPNVNRGFVAE